MPFDNNAPAYVAFWRSTLDKTRRLLTLPPTITLDELAPTPLEIQKIGGLPNFDLYRALLGGVGDGERKQTATMAAFAFAVPFRDVANDAALLSVASAVIGRGEPRTSWSFADGHTSVYSRALELRLVFFEQMLGVVRAHAVALDKGVADMSPYRWSTDECVAIERKLVLWRNGHVLLTLALDELGYVPSDEETWTVLLRHYSPDVNTFFHAGEMPDVRDELYATPFLREPSSAQSTQNKIRAANAVCLAFTKACPRRCGTRDMTEIMLEYSVRNVSTLYFLMLVMAASYLGVYDFCRRQPDWDMTRDIYRLFFFELASDLSARRRHALSEQDRLYARYAMDEKDIVIHSQRVNARVAFSDYQTALTSQYMSAALKSHKATAEVGAGNKQKAKRARTATDGTTRATSRQRAESVVNTIATTTTRSNTITIDDDEDE